MQKHKRIEITAFRRRVMIVSGQAIAPLDVVSLQETQVDGQETIDTGSVEGQETLREAIRLLEAQVSKLDDIQCKRCSIDQEKARR